MTHSCLDGVPSTEPSYWLFDGQGIELCRACDICKEQKLSRYRIEILEHYSQDMVDEPIEPEDE